MKHNYLCMLLMLLIILPAAADEWTYLQRDETVNRFSLDEKGKLSCDRKVIEGFEPQKTADKIAISGAPSGNLAVLFSIGEAEQCFLVHLDKSSAMQIPIEAIPIIWASWSPESSYLLLASSAGEAVFLFSVLPSSGQIRKIPVAVAGKSERQEPDTGSIEWIDAHTFRMEVLIYASGSEEVLRIQKMKIDAETLQITAE